MKTHKHVLILVVALCV